MRARGGDPDAREVGHNAMTPAQAVQAVASVTAMTRALRVRVEGLTLVIFSLCIMASYLTLVAPLLFTTGAVPGGAMPANISPEDMARTGRAVVIRGAPTTVVFLIRYGPLVWYAIAVATTVGVWRMMRLSFQTDLSTPRLLGVFVAWLGLFVATTVTVAYLEGDDPRSWHLLGWTIVLAILALTNPLRFARQSRVVAAIVAACALAAFLYASTHSMHPRDIGFLTGIAIGAPGLLGGLWLTYRG